MALTNSGFNGSVTETDWAYMAAIGQADGVESSAAWAVTQGTGRQTSVAAHNGRAYAKGVVSKDTAAILTSIGTPTNGQWYLLVRRINWSTDTVTVVAIAHTTTSTTVPTAAPAGLPTMSTTPGTEYDQPLAWVWVRSTDTTMFIVDLRKQPLETRMAAAEASVAVRQIQTYKWLNKAARDAQTGMTEGDLGDQADNEMRYRYDGTAWKNASAGLVPIVPTSVAGSGVVVSATGAVTFTAATSISINGCFTADFDNYVIVLNVTSKSAAGTVAMRLRAAGADDSSGAYWTQTVSASSTTTTAAAAAAATSWGPTVLATATAHTLRAEVFGPFLLQQTRGSVVGSEWVTATGAQAITTTGIAHTNSATAYDGFTWIPSTGNITGVARAYGYNN